MSWSTTELLPLSATATADDLVRAWAASSPDAPALTAASAERGAVRTLTYAALDRLVTVYATALTGFGVVPGERVGFLLTNTAGVEAVALYLAAHRSGAIALPINARLTGPEIADAVGRAAPRLVVAEDALADRLDAAKAAGAASAVPLGVDSGAGGGFLRAVRTASGAEPPAFAEVAPHDGADWLFTSGTTGQSKCVELSHRSCRAHAEMFARSLGLRADDIVYSTFPFYTSSGVHTSLLTCLGVGCHYVMATTTAAEVLVQDIAASGATVVGAVPSVLLYLSKEPAAGELDLTRVRLVFHGGAPVSPAQVGVFEALFPRAEVVNTYGQTESGNPGTYLPGRFATTKAGSIGRGGMYGVQSRVVAADGHEVEPPGIGELLLRSPAVMTRYVDDPAATEATLRDGWLHTGDIVRVDEDGFLFVYDRIKDIVLRGGFNISSLEVEAALTAFPGVLEAAVVPKPHPELGEDLVAFLVVDPDAGVVLDALAAHCRERLAAYKVPRDVRMVEALPKNSTGKVLKRTLRTNAARPA